MRKFVSFPLSSSLLLLCLLAGPAMVANAQRNAGGRPLHNEAERLARWKQTSIAYNRAGLSAREQAMIAKLADACGLMNDIYWRQSDLGGLAVYRVTRNSAIRGLFGIMGSRWDAADDNSPFLGEEPMNPGHELYHYTLTRAVIEQYVAQHPEQEAVIDDPYTVVRGTPEKIETIPYHVAYAEWLKPMARDLRQAAALSPDPAFAKFLRLRADALLTDNYQASDRAWLDLKAPKIDLIFGPNKTNLDNILGVKTSYGGAILIRDAAATVNLALYEKYLSRIQDALPFAPEDRPSMQGQTAQGQAAEIEVVDSPLRAGDLRYGYQAVAVNLPKAADSPQKKILFKNFLDARVNNVIVPLARQMMAPEQAATVSNDAYFTTMALHEICHDLGPAYARVDGKQTQIREAVGPAYSGLEEAKADVTGMFCMKWLVDHGAIPQAQLGPAYASYAAGLLREMRFGNGELHGRAGMMEFNYLVEQHAIGQTSDGKYQLDDAAMPGAIASLAQKLLTLEATGDRAGTEAWMKRYDATPPALTQAFAAAKEIPVDTYPVFSFSEEVR